MFYDQYDNLIQKQSDNLLQTASGLNDITTLVYREQGFVPQVLSTLKTQSTGTSLVKVRNRFAYDHAGRLLSVWQQHERNGQIEPEVLVARHTYDAQSQLVRKQLHSRDQGQAFLQSVDFRYNLHGQLMSINKADLTTNPELDVFGLELVREQTQTGLNNTARFDGGISAVRWQAHNAARPSATDTPERERSYRFSFDGYGRLITAAYAAKNQTSGTWSLEVGAFNERVLRYDANGNIKQLLRYTKDTDAAPVQLIDNLTYAYEGNRQTAIDDASGSTRGFRDPNQNTANEYGYDGNGSITRDDNKGVTYTFNALNKVQRQTVGTSYLDYTYDASGSVLQKRQVANGVTVKTQHFIDGFVYETTPTTTGLLSVPTSEGRALVDPAAPARLTYEYHLRDHLGNLRVAFRAQSQTEELRLTMDDPVNEEGPYPKFQNASPSRTDAFSRSVEYAAAVTTYQPGPRNRIPVADGDQLRVEVYCMTPNGVQYNRSAPVAAGPTMPKLNPLWALQPTLTPAGPPTLDGGSRPARFVPGIQLSATGMLAALSQKSLTSPASLQPLVPRVLSASIGWTLYNDQDEVVSSGQQTVPVTEDYNWRLVTANLQVRLPTSSMGTGQSRTGYIIVQLLNDGNQPVYFDDLSIIHPKDAVLVSQENHYYPWVQPKLSLRRPGRVEGFNVLAYQLPSVTHRADAQGQDPLCAVG
ncbi:hypothetical protein E5J99_20165, partial [Hymenobacter elongatus]